MSNRLTREPECCAFAERPRHRKHRRKLVNFGGSLPLIVPLHYLSKSYSTQVIDYKHVERVKGIEPSFIAVPFCNTFQQKERYASKQLFTIVQTYYIIPRFTRWDILVKDARGRSPFWYAVYRCADGIERRKSTKCAGKVAAREILRGLEAAELLGASGSAVEEQFRALIRETVARVTWPQDGGSHRP